MNALARKFDVAESLRPGDDPNAGGVKADAGKPRLELIPPEGITAVATILTFGAEKYGARNWEKGMDWSRPFGACLRHLYAWWAGEDRDPDTGKSHLWHAACNVFFLLVYEQRGIGKDDRHKSSGN